MAKLKWKLPPLYIPSSGSIVRVKFRMSSGLGKDVFIVRPRVPSSSARSKGGAISAWLFYRPSWRGILRRYLSVLVTELLSPSSSWALLPQRSHPFVAVVSAVVRQPHTTEGILTKAGAQRL